MSEVRVVGADEVHIVGGHFLMTDNKPVIQLSEVRKAVVKDCQIELVPVRHWTAMNPEED